MIQQLQRMGQVRSVRGIGEGRQGYPAGGGDVVVAIAGWGGAGENWLPRTDEV